MTRSLHLTMEGPSLQTPVLTTLSDETHTLGSKPECDVHVPSPGLAPVALTFTRVGHDWAVRSGHAGARLDGHEVRAGSPIVLRPGMCLELAGLRIQFSMSHAEDAGADRYTLDASATAVLEMAAALEGMDSELATLRVTSGLARGMVLRLGEDRSSWRCGGPGADLTLSPTLPDDALTLTRTPEETFCIAPGGATQITRNGAPLTEQVTLRSGDTLSIAGNALRFDDPLEGLLDDFAAPSAAPEPEPSATPEPEPIPDPVDEPASEPDSQAEADAAGDPAREEEPETKRPPAPRRIGALEVTMIVISLVCMAGVIGILLVLFEVI